jgi:hypothetical protein
MDEIGSQNEFDISVSADIAGIKEHVSVLNSEMGETRDSIKALDVSNNEAHKGIMSRIDSINTRMWIMSILIIIMSIIGPLSVSTISTFISILAKL